MREFKVDGIQEILDSLDTKINELFYYHEDVEILKLGMELTRIAGTMFDCIGFSNEKENECAIELHS